MSSKGRNRRQIVALRNEKGSYNYLPIQSNAVFIVALRNEKGSYNPDNGRTWFGQIVALRNEKGSYNLICTICPY